MLQAMKHRGPDSTGYALYGTPTDRSSSGSSWPTPTIGATSSSVNVSSATGLEVESRLGKIGASIDRVEGETEYAYRASVRYEGDLKALADYLEDVPGCEVLSLGHSLEIVKDLGDAEEVASLYNSRASRAPTPSATCGWPPSPTSTSRAPTRTGPTRSPTWRSCTTASSPTTSIGGAASSAAATGSSPSATPRSSPSTWPRRWPRATLEAAMKESLDDLDGVFTYMAVTRTASGVAKDEMAAKPLVLYESDDWS